MYIKYKIWNWKLEVETWKKNVRSWNLEEISSRAFGVKKKQQLENVEVTKMVHKTSVTFLRRYTET